MKSIIKSIFLTVIASAVTVVSAATERACVPCQVKQSIKDALIVQSLKDEQMAKLAAGSAFSRQAELDEYFVIEDEYTTIEEIVRAAREELADPCNNCGFVDRDRSNNVAQQLCALQCCCSAVARRLAKLAKDEKRCCKKLSHKIDHVEHLVESVIDETAVCCSVTESLLVSIIDQEAACCSVIETALGDPATASLLDIPLCVPISITDALINSTDADVLEWLKTIYELIYRVHTCVCCGG